MVREGSHLYPLEPVSPGRALRANDRLTSLPGACLVLLIAAAALNGVSLQIHGLSVYPEYIALGLVLTSAVVLIALDRLDLYLPHTLAPLGLWLAAELLATLLYAPDRHHSLILWLKLLLVVATYLAVANLARNRIGFAVGAQSVTASAIALLGIGAYVSWKLTGSHLGMQHPGRNLGQSWLPSATLREPDIFGSYLVAATLLGLPVALFLRRTRDRLRRAFWLIGPVTTLGIILSGSRTAWLALLAGLCLPVALQAAARPTTALRRALLPVLALTAAAFALAAVHINPASALPAFNPQANGDLVQRAVSFGHLSSDHNIVTRVEIARNALTHWRTHPLTGWGVGAYGEVYRTPPPDTSQAGWISNLPLHLLYDSGVLGLAAFAVALALLTLRGIKFWQASWGLTQAAAAGILLALFGLLVAFQATEATWFAYPWIYLGLLEAAMQSRPARRVPSLEVVG